MGDPLDHDRWEEIDAVFMEALDLDPSEWQRFLDRRCAGDAELREAAWSLLTADRQSGSFLEASADELASEELFEAIRLKTDGDDERIGRRVGQFRILRRLGRGGMAGVYLAERADGEFEQRVAIKFLRRGLDTEDFVRRFVAERQILSSLEHPNIARLVDGGTTERGLPYLALEYVDGVPITQYCDQHRSTLEERLRLFIQVARAVQYAHANLIVHRDIKPSNILVTAAGQAKLLDFGIAKLLDPDSEAIDAPLTRTGLRPLTPEYASPEQVRGDAITTASDVYQLGVLLYRLLTGERPYHVTGTGPTLEDTISHARPKPPSQAILDGEGPASDGRGRSAARLSRRLRGDLDTIVLKALRKDPARRYQTALEMADDVQHHLAGRPITARRESRLYRTGKFLRRHAWVAPVSAAAIVGVGAYIATLVRHGRQLEEERNVARDVQAAFVSFFTAPDSGDVGLGEGRRHLTILEAIQEGTGRVRQDLADRPAARAELFGAMAAVLEDLDEPAAAYELATEALGIERALYGDESPEVHETLLRVGALAPDPDSGRAILQKQLDLSRSLYGPEHASTAHSLYALADLDLREGKPEDAVSRLEAAIEIYRTSEAVHPTRLAWALGELSENLGALGRVEYAERAARESYEILAGEFGDGHSQTATYAVVLAKALNRAGRYEESRELYESSLSVLDTELGPTHATTLSVRNNYAVLLSVMGDYQAAEAVYRQQIEAQRQRFGEVHSEVAASLQNLATALKHRGRHDEAERLSTEAHDLFMETRGPGFFQTAFPLLTITEIRLIRGDYEAAEASSRRALELLGLALPPGHPVTAVAQCRVGQALAGQGRTLEARPLLAEGTETLRASPDHSLYAHRDACVAALEAL